MHPREQPDEIILTPQREHRVDQVMADPSFALLDFEAVGEKVEELVRCLIVSADRIDSVKP